jgi:hypothetical protein
VADDPDGFRYHSFVGHDVSLSLDTRIGERIAAAA